MGSPITFSGFNQIDFNSILNAIMLQERQPVTALEAQRTSLKSQQTAFTTLATKLAALESAARDLASTTAFGGRTATSSDSAAVALSATGAAATGTYDVVVTDLARAQTTAVTSTHTDKDLTVVASGGSIVIDGVAVTVTVPTTLEQLAEAINATEDIGVTATVVSPAPGQYKLVLMGKSTGSAGAFTIENTLTGGTTPVTFADTDGNGISGDSDADNAVQATDARATVNNVPVSSATNVLADVIPGATITLLKKDPAATVTLSVTQDLAAGTALVKQFVTAFNDLMRFAKDQSDAAGRGDRNNIGRDALLRGLRTQLRADINGHYPAGGTLAYLSQVGIGFERTGEMTLDETKFEELTAAGTDAITKLFAGAGGVGGAFVTLQQHISTYTSAGGLIPDARQRLDEQVQSIGVRIDALEARLAVRRNALSMEFVATDRAMSALNSSISALSSLGGQYRLF